MFRVLLKIIPGTFFQLKGYRQQAIRTFQGKISIFLQNY